MIDHQEDRCDARIIHQDRINMAKARAIDPADVVQLARFFKAFGDPTRIKILHALDSGEMCVCDIAATLGITESATSHQLRHLRQLNLVSNRREGTVLYYRLDDEHIANLLQLALEHIHE
jgi:DNA-binding transcriptional ArsR family regulator